MDDYLRIGSEGEIILPRSTTISHQRKFYLENEFDINLFPFVVQVPLYKKFDLRITSVSNYHFGTNNSFSDIDLQIVTPVFLFNRKGITNSRSSGIYIGPILGIGRNLMKDHYIMTVGMEPGYMFPTVKKFTITLGVQFDGSYFAYDNQDNLWREHFGFKINLGYWVSRAKG